MKCFSFLFFVLSLQNSVSALYLQRISIWASGILGTWWTRVASGYWVVQCSLPGPPTVCTQEETEAASVEEGPESAKGLRQRAHTKRNPVAAGRRQRLSGVRGVQAAWSRLGRTSQAGAPQATLLGPSRSTDTLSHVTAPRMTRSEARAMWRVKVDAVVEAGPDTSRGATWKTCDIILSPRPLKGFKPGSWREHTAVLGSLQLLRRLDCGEPTGRGGSHWGQFQWSR